MRLSNKDRAFSKILDEYEEKMSDAIIMKPKPNRKDHNTNPAKFSISNMFSSGSDWWHNACLNYMGVDINTYAVGYKLAGDLLVERVKQTRGHQDTLVYPIAFLYRQYIELRLKELIRVGSYLLDIPFSSKKLTHEIFLLWKECRNILEQVHPDEYKEDFDEIENYIEQYAQTDPQSTAFRYPTDKKGEPSLKGLKYINLRNLAEIMGKVAILLDGASEELDLLFQDKCEMDSWYKG